MKHVLGSVVLAVLVALPADAAAQPLSGFGTFTFNSDVNGQVFPGFSGGLLLDMLHSWVSVGGEGDVFVSWPYFAGRFGPVVQVNPVRHPRLRLFGIGGISWGEQAGPMIGAGVEVWPHGRVGFRASVQDYLARIERLDCQFYGSGQSYCDATFSSDRSSLAHQPTIQIGMIWR